MKNLDRWIAEKIMGETFCEHDFDIIRYGKTIALWECKKCGKIQKEWLAVEEPDIYQHIPPYTTNLNLAFKAAEKICGVHGHFNIDKCGGPNYFCVISGGKRKTTEDAEHKNPATAVCLAIFKLYTGKTWKENTTM